MQIDPDRAGQMAYETFLLSLAPAQQPANAPPWNALPETLQRAWRAAADAVLNLR